MLFLKYINKIFFKIFGLSLFFLISARLYIGFFLALDNFTLGDYFLPLSISPPHSLSLFILVPYSKIPMVPASDELDLLPNLLSRGEGILRVTPRAQGCPA